MPRLGWLLAVADAREHGAAFQIEVAFLKNNDEPSRSKVNSPAYGYASTCVSTVHCHVRCAVRVV
jgi:hypothetical protein